jgi:hypothetical protein
LKTTAIFISFQNQKVRQPESPHRKTPTPIVAKQKTNDMENTIRKLAESTFLPLFTNLRKKIKKGIKPPIKIRRFPSNHYSFFVWHTYYSTILTNCK